MSRLRPIFLLVIAAFAMNAARAYAQTPPASLAAFAKAWSAINGYHTQAHCYSVGTAQSSNSSYDYTFTKPSSISLNILSGPGAGNSVSWSGGDTVVAGRGIFKKSFALTDPTVTSARGETVVDLSFGAILQHTQQTQGTLSSSSSSLDGAAVNVLSLNVSNPSTDHDLTREVLYLSSTSNLPVRVDGYAGSQLVSSCTFSDTTT